MIYNLIELHGYKIIITASEYRIDDCGKEYDILGYGKTDEEAYKMAFENILNSYTDLSKGLIERLQL